MPYFAKICQKKSLKRSKSTPALEFSTSGPFKEFRLCSNGYQMIDDLENGYQTQSRYHLGFFIKVQFIKIITVFFGVFNKNLSILFIH